MIEWLNGNVLYWHWIVFGLLLITLELFNPIFVTLWLGLAAIFVGVLELAYPLSVSGALIAWAVLSTAFLLLWHTFISPKIAKKPLRAYPEKRLSGRWAW